MIFGIQEDTLPGYQISLASFTIQIIFRKPFNIIIIITSPTLRITQRFMTRESKAKDTIDHLKKKVEKYDEQLQYFKKGTLMPLPQQPRYGHKVRNHFKKIG